MRLKFITKTNLLAGLDAHAPVIAEADQLRGPC